MPKKNDLSAFKLTTDPKLPIQENMNITKKIALA